MPSSAAPGRCSAVTGGIQISVCSAEVAKAARGSEPAPFGRRGWGNVTGRGGGWSLRGGARRKETVMRVLVMGATGALGRFLVPGRVAAGHEVTAATRAAGKVARVRAAGAEPAAVAAAAPEVIVHQMTAVAGLRSLRNRDKAFAVTSELRTRGTDNLLAAAARAGTRRVIAQGYAGPGPDKPSSGGLKAEDDPPGWRAIPSAARMAAAITHVDQAVPAQAAEGLVLRYGTFYGPGASDAPLELVRRRRVPVVGGGAGVWSFVEITDAAAATLAAVGAGAPGVYNVVDDDPAPVADWLPYLAQVAGAKPPRRVPAWLGRLLAGEFVTAQMTTARGSSNHKAKKELGWQPRYPSWREGFRAWVSG